MITKYECGDTIYIPVTIKSAMGFPATGILYEVSIPGGDEEIPMVRESDLVETEGRTILDLSKANGSKPTKWW